MVTETKKPWEMKTPKNMALSTDLEPTKPSSWHFGKQPDRHGLNVPVIYQSAWPSMIWVCWKSVAT